LWLAPLTMKPLLCPFAMIHSPWIRNRNASLEESQRGESESIIHGRNRISNMIKSLTYTQSQEIKENILYNKGVGR
jgi:hypothetical protein